MALRILLLLATVAGSATAATTLSTPACVLALAGSGVPEGEWDYVGALTVPAESLSALREPGADGPVVRGSGSRSLPVWGNRWRLLLDVGPLLRDAERERLGLEVPTSAPTRRSGLVFAGRWVGPAEAWPASHPRLPDDRSPWTLELAMPASARRGFAHLKGMVLALSVGVPDPIDPDQVVWLSAEPLRLEIDLR
jgi:hypothetical protein